MRGLSSVVILMLAASCTRATADREQPPWTIPPDDGLVALVAALTDSA